MYEQKKYFKLHCFESSYMDFLMIVPTKADAFLCWLTVYLNYLLFIAQL